MEERALRMRKRKERRVRQQQVEFSQSTLGAPTVYATQPAADACREHVDSVGATKKVVHAAGDVTDQETTVTPDQFAQLAASIQALHEESIASSRLIQDQLSKVIFSNEDLRNDNYHLSCQLSEAWDVLHEQALASSQYTQEQLDLLLTTFMPETLA